MITPLQFKHNELYPGGFVTKPGRKEVYEKINEIAEKVNSLL